MVLSKESPYTIDDIYALPDGERAELFDGEIYSMAPPTRKHQRIVGEVFAMIREYIIEKGGKCEVNIAPFAVFLYGDNRNYVEPDVWGHRTGLSRWFHREAAQWITIKNCFSIAQRE